MAVTHQKASVSGSPVASAISGIVIGSSDPAKNVAHLLDVGHALAVGREGVLDVGPPFLADGVELLHLFRE